MDTIEKTLKYYPLLMTYENLNKIKEFPLPEGFSFQYFQSIEKDLNAWISIHIKSGEFTDESMAKQYFFDFYKNFLNELDKRLFFIVDNKTKEKVATSTVSIANDHGYNCVVDWLAISKDYQGKKLSKPLICQTLKTAKNLGYNKIMLHTQTHTWLAAKLYLDLGFEPLFEKDLTGWQILKSITHHDKLARIVEISQEDIFNPVFVNVYKELNKIHTNFAYEIWDENCKNDISVRENNKVFKYKFYDEGKIIKRVNQGKHKE